MGDHSHSKCDCHDIKTAEKALLKPGFDANLAAQGITVSLLILALAKTLAPKAILAVPGGAAVLPHLPAITTVLIAIVAAVVVRGMLVGTCCIPSRQLTSKEINAIINARDIKLEERIKGNTNALAQRLSRAIQIPTISYERSDSENSTDYNQFLRLHALMQESFPKVHATMKRHVINNYSLVYIWEGSDPSQKPYLLTAHMDVVPAPEPEKWKEEPFSGAIKDGYVWGRGAVDDKQGVMGWMEAAEELISSGFKPRRTIYFAFGHDEEVSGVDGAANISKWFSENVGSRDIFEFMMDEGLFILEGAVPGHKKPVAFVCVAEKGYLSLKLTVESTPGHASAPPPETAIGILAKAVKRIEDNPHVSHFDGPAHELFGSIRAGFSGVFRFVFSNMWLFTPLLKKILSSKPTTATMVRTTTALTIFKAGIKDNVVPSAATAVVNHRIHPKDCIKTVIEWDKKVVNDPRVQFEILGHSIEPAPMSSSDHPAFHDIRDAIHAVFKGSCAVAPGLFVAASDSKYYWNLAPQIFRFNPICMRSDEVSMFHGFNERISIDNYAELVTFCANVILNSDKRYVSVKAADSDDAAALRRASETKPAAKAE